MARAHRFAALTLVLSVLYLLALFQVVPVPFVEEKIASEILPFVPWWLLVTFGSYSLLSVGHALWTFRDCPEAYTELMVAKEISQAKDDLRAKGVSVD